MGCGGSVNVQQGSRPPQAKPIGANATESASVPSKAVVGCPDAVRQISGHVCTKDCSVFVKKRTKHAVQGCPNMINPYHTCTSFCKDYVKTDHETPQPSASTATATATATATPTPVATATTTQTQEAPEQQPPQQKATGSE